MISLRKGKPVEEKSDTAKAAALWFDMRKAKLCLPRPKKMNYNNYYMKRWEPGIWEFG